MIYLRYLVDIVQSFNDPGITKLQLQVKRDMISQFKKETDCILHRMEEQLAVEEKAEYNRLQVEELYRKAVI